MASSTMHQPWRFDIETILRRPELVREDIRSPSEGKAVSIFCVGNLDPQIVADSDTVQGLAGFVPNMEKTEGEPKDAFSEDVTSEIEDEFINQYHSHVELAGIPSRESARVSLCPRDQSRLEASLNDADTCIRESISNIVSQLRILKGNYRLFDKLLFIRTRSSTLENQADENSVEIASIQLKKIHALIDAYYGCIVFFEQKPDVSNNRGGFYFTCTESAKGRYIEFRDAKLLAGKKCLYTFFLRDSDLKFKRNLDPLMLALAPLLKALRIDQFDWGQNSGSTQFALLHLISLVVVQSLNLILQSYLRGSVAPFRFHFLTTPIYEFILEGTDRSPQAPKVYATSQELSCLGDMLGQKVLVFGLQKPSLQKRMDIVATPRQLDILWGPTSSNSPEESEDANHDYYTDDEYPDISVINIKGGIIIPTGETLEGLPEWHWRRLDEATQSNINSIVEKETCIDIHTPILIGARQSLHK